MRILRTQTPTLKWHYAKITILINVGEAQTIVLGGLQLLQVHLQKIIVAENESITGIRFLFLRLVIKLKAMV